MKNLFDRKEENSRQPLTVLAAIWFTLKHRCFPDNQDALSLLISSTCRCLTLRNPEECTTIWCWMSSWNLFRLLSSETYSSFQIWLRTQSSNIVFDAGDISLVKIPHELTFNLVQSKPGLYCISTDWLIWWLLYYCCHCFNFYRDTVSFNLLHLPCLIYMWTKYIIYQSDDDL